jgi:mannitol/fructose-specific phosphotransferase system IIA component (Ntr-type)
MVKWQRILRPDNIVIGIEARSAIDAVRRLAETVQQDAVIQKPKIFLRDILDLESVGWSCIGKGVALPHVQADYVTHQLLAIGVLEQGIDFGALDGKKVNIMAMMATPKRHHKQHVQVLAGLSRLLQNDSLREQLVGAADPAAVLQVFSPPQ